MPNYKAYFYYYHTFNVKNQYNQHYYINDVKFLELKVLIII
jgi:hypothetical protein